MKLLPLEKIALYGSYLHDQAKEYAELSLWA